jgi:hypothetical protein
MTISPATMVQQPLLGQKLLITEALRSHSDRTPLDERSARRRNHYLITHNTYNRETSMPPAGFEPTIPANELPQNHVLECVDTGNCREERNIKIAFKKRETMDLISLKLCAVAGSLMYGNKDTLQIYTA